jgi:hypothetical protein
MPLRNPFKKATVMEPPPSAEFPELQFRDTNVIGSKPIDEKPPIEFEFSGKYLFEKLITFKI